MLLQLNYNSIYLSHCFPQHNCIPTAYWSFMLHCHKFWMLIMRIKVDLIIHDNNIPIPTIKFWALIPRNILSENDAVHVYVYHWLSRHWNSNILHRGILFDRCQFGYHGVFIFTVMIQSCPAIHNDGTTIYVILQQSI